MERTGEDTLTCPCRQLNEAIGLLDATEKQREIELRQYQNDVYALADENRIMGDRLEKAEAILRIAGDIVGYSTDGQSVQKFIKSYHEYFTDKGVTNEIRKRT